MSACQLILDIPGRNESTQRADHSLDRESRGTKTFLSTFDGKLVIDEIVSAMERLGYPETDRFAVHLALEEAIVNAIVHGNRSDPEKYVYIEYEVTSARVFTSVQDEGAGFDPTQVPDPTLPENRDLRSGRGLLLMRQHMSLVTFNSSGNQVRMCKYRSVGAGRSTADVAAGDLGAAV